MLSGLADRVWVVFQRSSENHLGRESSSSGDHEYSPTAERFAEREGLRLLVLGGSLGAQVLNEIIPQGMALLRADELPQIVHQAGRNTLRR